MNDLEDWEIAALDYASEMAGQYIEELQSYDDAKSDLSKLSGAEWQTLIKVIAINYHQKRNELKPCPF